MFVCNFIDDCVYVIYYLHYSMHTLHLHTCLFSIVATSVGSFVISCFFLVKAKTHLILKEDIISFEKN